MLVTLLAGGVGAVVAFVSGEGVPPSFGWGVATGGAAFLAWAIGREVDPDRTWVAGAATPMAVSVVALGRPSLVAAGAALLAARTLARTTGRPATGGDLVVLVGLAGWAAATPAGVPAGIVLGLSLIVDPSLAGGSPRRVGLAGIAALGVVVAVATVTGSLVPDPGAVSGWQWAVLGASLIGGVTVLIPTRTTEVADQTGEPLDATRLRAGRAGAAAAALGALAWAGGPGIVALAPAGTALFAAMLPFPIRNGGAVT